MGKPEINSRLKDLYVEGWNGNGS